MAIRSRISTTAVAADENVRTKINKNDARGTATLTGNPYQGSYLDRAGVPQEYARPIAMGAAYLFTPPHPNSLPVQDLLANVRMMSNPGWNVEYVYRQRTRSPLTGIRGFCVVTCQSGSVKAVAQCKDMSCPFWALRMGKNRHYGQKS